MATAYQQLNLFDQLDHQHGDATGYVCIAQGVDGWHEDCYEADELPMVAGGTNVYGSQNVFAKPKRRVANIQQLRTLFCDVDCYREGLTPDQALWQLEKDFLGSVLPIPNTITLSGRGLYLTWYITPAPIEALPLWQYAEDWIADTLAHVGADPAATDAARVLRLAGTVNSKSGTAVQVFHQHDERLTLEEWQEFWLPDEAHKREKRKKTGTRGKLKHIFSTYVLNYWRMADIEKLVDLRGGDCAGCRELILFVYRVHSLAYLKDKKQALESAYALNSRFTEPLPWREVATATKSAERRQYTLKNEWIIKELGITSEEQRQLKTIIGKAEKYRRNNEKRSEARRSAGKASRGEYLTNQEQTTQERLQAVIALKQAGMKQAEIAEKLGMSDRHVRRLLRE